MQPEIRPRKRAPLSAVLLVGGATRMPAVRAFLRNMTGLEPLGAGQGGVDPDEAVALGAAVQVRRRGAGVGWGWGGGEGGVEWGCGGGGVGGCC